VERLRWALLAVAAAAGAACVGATVDPALEPIAYVAVVVLGLVVSAVLWTAGRSRSSGWRGWRLLALTPLFPVLGAGLAVFAQATDPLQVAVFRWVPTVPGYALAVVAILTLVDRSRLRGGRRALVELALFVLACLVVVQLLLVGPEGRWAGLHLDEQLILGAAVVVTSLTMAAALTLLGAVEANRQRMALVLLAGAVALTAGRGLSTSALLLHAHGAGEAGRFLVVAGLTLFGLAVFADPGPRTTGTSRPLTGRSTELGHVLPHAAMLVAVAVIAGSAITGHRPNAGGVFGAVGCVALAAVHRVVTARDEQRMGARLRRNEAYFRSLVASAADAVLILDAELRVTWASPALDRSLGDAAPRLPGEKLLDAVHGDDVAALAAALPTAPDAALAPAHELLALRLADADGTWRWFEAGVSDLREDADVGAVVLHCRDVTERHEREEALSSIAYTDPMTGLPNSAGLLRVVRRTLAEPAEPDGRTGASLLLIELEGLAEVREHAGRDVVTGVVAEVGRRLRATVRGDDVVARMGGGAFGVLARSTATEADQLADRCLALVEQPIATATGIVDLTASVGLVIVEPGLTEADLFSRAALAVRAARAAGAGSASRYTEALGEAAARRERLRADLQTARSRGELSLLYSPIVSLEEQRVTGVEAHLRWRHSEFGDVPPTEFLPIAERSGLIGDLQRWALEEASSAVQTLPSAGAPLRLGIDISLAYIAGGTLAADVDTALQRSGLAPERLVLEIPEATVLADDERVAMDVASVRLMGVHVALDHFGTGQSGLANLTRLPIDILKLDRSFLARVDRDTQDRALCESVVGIGRALGVDVVAEGVETPAQLGLLVGFDCGFAQGFLLARPLPLGELTELLGDRAGVLWPGLVGQR
jgi:diguanylate cyclase (GGDEF)-like protein/PAS domain S-box-containing protein